MSKGMPSQVPLNRKRTRKNVKRGGFYPSIMGSFITNVESAIVPMALYTLYHMFVPKKGQSNHSQTKKNRSTEYTA